MKKQLRYGFTLVELLVVISIIGMLAGLLLPAVNAARESGRRAVCMANQSQVAMALLNYESARGAFPPMRGEVYSTSTTFYSAVGHQATWVGYLLPLMEYNVAWERLSGGRANTTSGVFDTNGEAIPIPILKCKSASKPAEDASMSYVVNGGYQNGVGTTWATVTTIATGTTRFEPGRREDAPFFDFLGVSTSSGGSFAYCKQTVSVDYISTHNGTSYTLLLSENLDAGKWATYDTAAGVDRPRAEDETKIAFCYPIDINDGSTAGSDITTIAKVLTVKGQLAAQGWTSATDAKCSWRGYDLTFDPTIATGDTVQSPTFINVGRTRAGEPTSSYRLARPSSNHPGTVVAAFADRSVRTLNENMNKKLFVQICRPASGDVINPAELNQ